MIPGRVALHTLGCKVNQYDGEALLAAFRRRGWQVVDFRAPADVYVVNTCTVTGAGERESRQLVRRARRRNPAAVVVVAGCYAQVAPQAAAALPGVDVVLGTGQGARVVELVEAVRRGAGRPLVAVGDVLRAPASPAPPAPPQPGRTRAVVKVQEGCAEFCSYCIVPYARGRPRSRPVAEVAAEVAALAAAGYREVVLAGTHLGAYGRDLAPDAAGRRPGLADLLLALDGVAGLARVRLSSLEPMDVDEDLLRAMAALPKVCPHLHLPLQSGCDRVLARMRRRYTAAAYRRLVERARDLIPGLAVTTDLIVGFPGESEEDHRETVSFVRALGFARLHVFPYSPRAGTPAARFPDRVPAAVQARRVRELLAVGEELALAAHRRLLGRTVAVLVEGPGRGGWLQGYTPEYVRVRFPGDPAPPPGAVVPVRVRAADARGVSGEPTGAPADAAL